ncbi:hypothetical protein BDF19DRAFT_71700 [Syncephalis fuscata]|nr:hypothetical protein BDF19DRAFT_71700 [Syncephalis fuscata]
MGTTQNLVNNDMDWRHNATRLWGIPLHPSGEAPLYSFIAAVPNDRHDAQARLFAIYTQTIINLLASLIFISNLAISIRMVLNRPQFLSGWCFLISSLFGAGWFVIVVPYFFEILNCRETIWYILTAFSVVSIGNSIVILQKAYIVLLKQRWVLVVGIILILPQLGFTPFVITVSYITFKKHGGCVANYPISMPLYWFGVTIPVNILFSGIFSYIAYQQYKTFGSEAWRRLTRNGIQIMCLVVFCNIICAYAFYSK